MAQYPGITLTNAGINMIAESQASGTALIFTNLKMGDGKLSDGEDIKALTAVKNPLLTALVSSYINQGDGQIKARYVVSNSGLTTGFFAREIGIYAKLGTNGAEQLYAYTNAGNLSDYIPDKSTPVDEQIIDIYIVVSNASGVTVVTDSSIVYMTKKDLDEHKAAADSHAPAFAAHNADTGAHADIRAALKKAGGVPIGTITARLSKKPEAGELALDTGALVSRATYPDLWTWVQANAPLLSETDWQTQAAAQTSVGAYSTGDGSTTFRLPRLLDYFRGGAAADVGKWQGDAIRNITGSAAPFSDYPSGDAHNAVSGAFSAVGNGYIGNASVSPNDNARLDFDASRVVPTADENRPKTIKVLYCVKAFDAETNPGLVDLTALANEVAGKQPTLGYIRVWDQKASGTSGGTFTGGAWRTRDLNQLKTYGNISGVSLSSNQLTIPAGTYLVRASAPGNNVDGHKIRLRNITTGTTISVGSVEQAASSGSSDWIQTNSILSDVFTVDTTTVLELQHYGQSTFASYGFGSAMASGEVEIYTNLELQKIR